MVLRHRCKEKLKDYGFWHKEKTRLYLDVETERSLTRASKTYNYITGLNIYFLTCGGDLSDRILEEAVDTSIKMIHIDT